MAGFFEGLLEENLYRLGQSALRFKTGTFYGFPEDIAINGLVNFYFHTYNILGDPELAIWTDTPRLMSLEIPDQNPAGSQMVQPDYNSRRHAVGRSLYFLLQSR